MELKPKWYYKPQPPAPPRKRRRPARSEAQRLKAAIGFELFGKRRCVLCGLFEDRCPCPKLDV